MTQFSKMSTIEVQAAASVTEVPDALPVLVAPSAVDSSAASSDVGPGRLLVEAGEAEGVVDGSGVPGGGGLAAGEVL